MSSIWFLVFVLAVAIAMVAWMSRTAGPRSKKGKWNGGVARRTLTDRQREVTASEWDQVKELVEIGRPSNLSSAVIEADKLLDFTLKGLGAAGDTLGERLRSAEPRFSDYQGIWEAHKLRNKLVHESEYEPNRSEIERTVTQFERALRDLGALR